MKPKKHNGTKKTQKDFNNYRNMAKIPMEDNETEEQDAFNSLKGTNEIKQNDLFNNKEEEKVQEAPVIYKLENFFERYITQIIIGILGTFLVWNIGLQIGQATQAERIKALEEDIKDVETLINEKYIIRDVHDIQVENLEKEIEELKTELREIKTELNNIKK